MNQLLKLLLICPVLLFIGNTCSAQFSDGKASEWAPLNGTVDSVIINEFAVVKNDTGQSRERKVKIILAYNKKGDLIHEDSFRAMPKQQPAGPDRRIQKISNTYDDKGRLSSSVFYNFNNIACVKDVYTFNSDSSIMEDKRYGIPDNVLIETTRLQLDKAGNITDRSTYDNSSKLLSKFTTKYNDSGQRIEQTEFGLSISPNNRKWLNTFDAGGNLIKQVYYAGENAVIAGDTASFVYTKFDDQHNWLVKNSYVKGKLTRVAERVIAYYK